MKKTELPAYQTAAGPFAYGGTKNTVPETNDQSTASVASWQYGFPPRTSQPTNAGGIPPSRLDMNALGYTATLAPFLWGAGSAFPTFTPSVSAKIGGYPLDARLFGVDSSGQGFIVRSTKDDNTDNFVSNPSFIGTSWVYDMVTAGWVNAGFLAKNSIRTWSSGWFDLAQLTTYEYTPSFPVNLNNLEKYSLMLWMRRNSAQGIVYDASEQGGYQDDANRRQRIGTFTSLSENTVRLSTQQVHNVDSCCGDGFSRWSGNLVLKFFP